jgi:hypothetical protein
VEEWARCLVEVAARMAAESSCTLSAQGFHSAVGAVEWRDARGFVVQMVVLRIFDLSAFP